MNFSIRTRTKDKDKEVISSPREIVPFFSLYLVLVPNPNPELVKSDAQSVKTFEICYNLDSAFGKYLILLYIAGHYF